MLRQSSTTRIRKCGIHAWIDREYVAIKHDQIYVKFNLQKGLKQKSEQDVFKFEIRFA